jgi:hypothetical protein
MAFICGPSVTFPFSCRRKKQREGEWGKSRAWPGFSGVGVREDSSIVLETNTDKASFIVKIDDFQWHLVIPLFRRLFRYKIFSQFSDNFPGFSDSFPLPSNSSLLRLPNLTVNGFNHKGDRNTQKECTRFPLLMFSLHRSIKAGINRGKKLVSLCWHVILLSTLPPGRICLCFFLLFSFLLFLMIHIFPVSYSSCKRVHSDYDLKMAKHFFAPKGMGRNEEIANLGD